MVLLLQLYQRKQLKIDAVILVESYIRLIFIFFMFVMSLQTFNCVIQLYLKTFEVYKVIDFIFTRENLHLLEGYIYYNLVMFIMNL